MVREKYRDSFKVIIAVSDINVFRLQGFLPEGNVRVLKKRQYFIISPCNLNFAYFKFSE